MSKGIITNEVKHLAVYNKDDARKYTTNLPVDQSQSLEIDFQKQQIVHMGKTFTN